MNNPLFFRIGSAFTSVLFFVACSSPHTETPNKPSENPDFIQAKALSFEQIILQSSPEPSWQTVLDSGQLEPLRTFTKQGVIGGKVDINNALIEQGPNSDVPIAAEARKLMIHAVGNPTIPHQDFAKWSRWYQEDGNTQIFRLFKDEENVSNQRLKAARIEAFSPSHTWRPQADVWREFNARFTIVQAAGCVAPHYCSIFQAKGNNIDHWSVMLRVDDKGDLWFSPRRGAGFENSKPGVMTLIGKNVLGKPFDMRVVDNGNDYKMYINGQLVGQDQWPRADVIGFRWGIYMGKSAVADDIMVLITGANMK